MIKTIGVVGAGQMGNGIAHVFALNRHPVILCDTTEARLAEALATIRGNLERQAQRGLWKRGRSTRSSTGFSRQRDLTDLAAADFVMEAVTGG